MARKPTQFVGERSALIDHMAAAIAHQCGVEFDGLTLARKNHWRGLLIWALDALKNNVDHIKNAEARETVLRLVAYLEKDLERVQDKE